MTSGEQRKWAIRSTVIGVGLMTGTFQTVFNVDCTLAGQIKFLAGMWIGLMTAWLISLEKKS